MPEFSKIVAVSGLPGLYELVSSRSNGAIVRNLQDGRSQFVSGRTQSVLALENVAIFLHGDNSMPVREVLYRMQQQESQNPAPDPQADPAALENYLSVVVPDYDRRRVHHSDMRRLLRWYHLLKQHHLIPPPEPQPEAAGDSAETKA
ncbi:MAG: DUF5606 domain-containing protein [Chitinophagales bacterium]|nr:DUF5606 domain-containing protein [Chitinophagales bacterium]MDW8393794.1 DUF5606 domain-containing protein [Chitinophagales bacterium]